MVQLRRSVSRPHKLPEVVALSPFITGVVLAFGLILPLGAQNLFIFSQGASHRRLTGALPAVVTASLADTALIVIAVSGASLLLANEPGWQRALALAGVLFLLYMGWATWPKRAARPAPESAAAPPRDGSAAWPARRQIVFALSVSLLNPHALLDTIGVIGVTALQFPTPRDRLLFTVACIGVSWMWFAGLAAAGHLLRRTDPSGRTGVWLGRGSAVLMWLIAARLLTALLAG